MIIDGKEMFAKEVIEDFDPQKKSIIWKVIDEDLLELYNSFTVISSCEHQWATFTLAYEKKSEEKPEPLGLLAYFIEVTKDIEGHLLKKEKKNIHDFQQLYIYMRKNLCNDEYSAILATSS